MRCTTTLAAAVTFLGLAAPFAATAQPARIIILRHAEKLDAHALCDTGQKRALALAHQFLGLNAAQSLFSRGEKPAAMLAISLHSLETLTPAAQSWSLPVVAYGVTPGDDEDARPKEAELNKRTQEAVSDVMSDPRYDGRIVVMAWEHKHIAKSKLEKDYSNEDVTLRQLLRLEHMAGVPKSWPDSTYDYFWIVDYAAGKPIPIAFDMVKQIFLPPYDKLPANDWDEPEPLHVQAGCAK